MEIKTKLGIGDSAWCLHKSHATPVTVSAIVITETGVYYTLHDSNAMRITADEYEVFTTKQELLDYVAGE